MMYITREFENLILQTFQGPSKKGLILAGIVGCGKTTLVEHCLETLRTKTRVFEFTGDDLQFRSRVADDTKFLFNEVVSQTQEKALIFVDEVQKSEAIFDALKYAFDKGNISFLVTGSNPEYLNTIARKRLQRRAEFMTMLPFSLSELFFHHGFVRESLTNSFSFLLLESKGAEIPVSNVSLSSEMKQMMKRYLSVGGLPLAFLSPPEESFIEVRKTVERGFEALLVDARDIREMILIELARVHSREFTYTNLFKKTGLRRREQINKIILQLKGHGYLLSKKPLFFTGSHRSYLTVYSYIDPGIVSYLLGAPNIEEATGPKIEGYVHARLSCLIQKTPLKTELGYFKPYKVEKGGDIKFFPGEIDFIYQVGKRTIPIEVKATREPQDIDKRLITEIVHKYGFPFGIVLYGGVPFLDKEEKLVYWPWWGV